MFHTPRAVLKKIADAVRSELALMKREREKMNRPRLLNRRPDWRPRLPQSMKEAQEVYRRWDGLNGRYYFYADIVLDDGRYLADVTFDGDSSVAVIISRFPDPTIRIYERPDLIGISIVAYLMTRELDGYVPTSPTAEDRERFRAAHTGGQPGPNTRTGESAAKN